MLTEGRVWRANSLVNKAFSGFMDAFQALENCLPPLTTGGGGGEWTAKNHYWGTQK